MDPAPKRRYHKGTSSRDTKALSESEDSRGGHWKSRSKKAKSSIEEDELSQPRICEETDPFTPRIRYFELPKKSQMPNNVKTYDGSDDPEDHLKKFQAATKVERWAMPTWCHMFNSTLTGYARAPSESKKPDGSNYYTPHRLQWKNNMANGTNTAASKNRGRGAFHLYMDEFRGCNIAVSVQWDHRKAMSEENSSSHIDSSRNAKIPGPRWGTHYLKQQDNPTGMHDGLRTRSIAFRCHSEEGQKALCDLLRRNLDVFAWKPANVTRVTRHITEHILNVREGCSPVRQKKRSQAPERNKAIQDEGYGSRIAQYGVGMAVVARDVDGGSMMLMGVSAGGGRDGVGMAVVARDVDGGSMMLMGVSAGGGRGGDVESRVRESDGGDRIDREMGRIFGVGRKSSPENFSGGCGGGRRWGGRERKKMVYVYICKNENEIKL
ncbi:hypothetical protein Tco_0746236 [Tanacetum coccineum]